ncbi:MAG: ParA family protein [Gammaproteobacteria bacterium]|nr:MAG: ParA family protein [Gammaproteobacteria bacterium]
MQTILIINSKGGSGKTTLATTIASYFASANKKTAIMDYDPQGSSLHWLKIRSKGANTIHAADAATQKGTLMRSLQMYVPENTEKLIIDAPAGVDGVLLQEMVKKTDFILIPVAPSTIDIHATAYFIKDLLLKGGIRKQKTNVAVVANRVRKTMPIYEPLERFLQVLSLPFLTKISDSDQYILAAEQGTGIFEMDEKDVAKEREEFEPILNWLNPDADQPAARPENVVNFDRVRV